MKRLSLLLLCVVTLLTAAAQTTRRRNLRPRRIAPTEAHRPDTITADSASFLVFGYEKTLRSSAESFFITNHTSDTVTTLIGQIEYLTTAGRQIHRRPFTSPVDLPPGQTRQITLPAWDKQKVWYYHLSPTPRTGTRATPFTIHLSITSYIK